MITIFNRREVLITLDMKRQADVRNALASKGIDYIFKTTNLCASSTGITGNVGINMDQSVEYKIYVHKKDFDRAKRVVMECPNR